MRLDLAPQRWAGWHYLVAAACTVPLIAPRPFFWNPPFWVLALLSAPASRSGRRIDRADRTAPIEAGLGPRADRGCK